MDMMTLWTIQHVRVLDAVRRMGVLRADGRRIWPEVRSSYRWLMQQMRERVPGYSGRYPVWAWMQKPDMRVHRYHQYPVVRIGFQVSKMRVLLSDFYAWHCVLNQIPVTLHEGEEHHAGTLGQKEIEQTWPRIFDLDLLAMADPEWVGRPVPQACLEEVQVSEIFHTQIFFPRKTS